MARGNMGLAGLAVSIFITVVVVTQMLGVTTEVQSDIEINETENPEGAAAVESIFTKTYTALQKFGTIIGLSVIGTLIAVVSGFAIYARGR